MATTPFKDINGNTWSIQGGQVAVNDTVDTSTNRVTALGEDASGLIWQENADNRYWSTSGPNSAWNPPGGTTSAPSLVDPSTFSAVAPVLPSSAPASSGTGSFHVQNGQIIDPNGHAFVAKGINVFVGQADASTIINTFPGINMVRVPITPSTDQTTLDTLVKGLTSKNVLVELEDHRSSGSEQNTLSGQAALDQAALYAGKASAYQDNPFVAFGSPNEPDNWTSIKAVTDQERTVYDAIRGTGSKALILMEERGGANPDAAQQNAGTFSTMTNIVWDSHFYGLGANYSTDPAVIAKATVDQAAAIQKVTSADGKVPVIFGEYGPSTTGSGYDANGLQTVDAVDKSGFGTLAWAWNAGADALVSGSGKTDFGTLVAQHIAG